MTRIATVTVLFLTASLASAQEKQALTGGGSGVDTFGSLVSLGLGLLVVIALIFGCAAMLKRMSGLHGMNSKAMRVVSVMAVGNRERVALVEVGGVQILLGITPSAIRTLHVFETPVIDADAAPQGDFSRKLQELLGRGLNPTAAMRKESEARKAQGTGVSERNGDKL